MSPSQLLERAEAEFAAGHYRATQELLATLKGHAELDSSLQARSEALEKKLRPHPAIYILLGLTFLLLLLLTLAGYNQWLP